MAQVVYAGCIRLLVRSISIHKTVLTQRRQPATDLLVPLMGCTVCVFFPHSNAEEIAKGTGYASATLLGPAFRPRPETRSFLRL